MSKQRLHSSVTTMSAAPKGRRRLTTQPCHHQSTTLSTKLCQEKTGAGGGVREAVTVTGRDEGEKKDQQGETKGKNMKNIVMEEREKQPGVLLCG